MAKKAPVRSLFRFFSIFSVILALSALAWQGIDQSNANPPAHANGHSQQKPLYHSQPMTRFAVFGDSGSGAKQQFDMAAQMNHYYDKKPYETVLVLGDVVYPDGNVDKLGEERFKKPYRYLLEDKHVPFIVALGNHDLVLGNVQTQLDFYKMPGRYYKTSIGKAGLIDVFVLDTNIYTNDKEQIFWLDKALAQSKAPWKIVIGHHPPFTSGLHGNNEGLQKTLVPLLVKYQVPLMLAGHDHHYERFAPIQGITYIVSGGGGAYLRPPLKSKTSSAKKAAIFHFLAAEANDKTLHIDVINREGQVFDTVTIKRPVIKPLQKLQQSIYGKTTH